MDFDIGPAKFDPDSSQFSMTDFLGMLLVVSISSWWKGELDKVMALVGAVLLGVQYTGRFVLKPRNAIFFGEGNVTGPGKRNRPTTLDLRRLVPGNPFRSRFPRGYYFQDESGNRVWVRQYAFKARTIQGILDALSKRLASRACARNETDLMGTMNRR